MQQTRPFLVASLALGLSSLFTATAQAEPTVLHAYENAQVTTNFTLDFPDLGINSTSNVFYTRFKLELDEETGAARFLDYNQQIESLQLPLGITTGRIQVQILESNGSYDADTQTFETNDIYEITFQNDLSAFGFQSPEILPSTSRGTITGGAAGAQSVEMTWQGEGEFQNSENPSQPFRYTYTCRNSTVIAASEADVPPLPTPDVCGGGVFNLFGLALMTLCFAGMKTGLRRRRLPR